MQTQDENYVRLRNLAKLQEIGKSCAQSIAAMVAAMECDYDRLEELRTKKESANGTGEWTEEDAADLAELEECAGDCESEDAARERIQEDPLCIELSGTWVLGEMPTADRALILLGTGGPAVRVVCELNSDMEPHRAWIEAQDWFMPWTEYHGDAISMETLLKYCSCFYFGEG